MKLSRIGLVLLFAACGGTQSQPPAPPPSAVATSPAAIPQTASRLGGLNVVPLPAKITPGTGSFTIDANTKVLYDERAVSAIVGVADFLASLLSPATGNKYHAEPAPGPQPHSIYIAADPSIMAEEAYRLVVRPEQIEIRARQASGLFYGVETLRQLLPNAIESKQPVAGATWSVPVAEIADAPRFKYRGMHLDSSRHFFPVSFVKKYIDLIALYKMNAFHWHLTDDQGWRIEIKKYPKLTQIGGYRKETLIGHDRDTPHKFDGQRYGGFYTQDEIRDVVSYAKERFVTIVPEIEMPGHSLAALAAYPELACTKGPFEVATGWGVFEDIYCPREKTFQFLQNVLTEVLDLFPGPYVHIGGDEVPKTRWKESRDVKQLIAREHLKDEEEAQSYFVKKMGAFLQSKGRRFIGWDEILEGGLAPNAIVMSWRGFEAGVTAAKTGHDVIMAPESDTYFDHYQDGDIDAEPLGIGGFTPVEKVYAFDPVPNGVTGDDAAHILGAEGEVWSEYITSPSQVEYMVFPRAAALAEVLWSPKAARNWDGFADRVAPHFDRLARLDVTTARHFFKVKQTFDLAPDGKVAVTLRTNAHDPVRYTIDGTDPTPASPLFQTPIVLDRTTTVKAAAARDGKLMAAPVADTYYVGPATGKPMKYAIAFSEKYAGARELALTNSQKGSKNFGDGQWLGFDGQDLDATLDLGKSIPLHRLEIDFLRDGGVWVMLPPAVEFAVSDDGKNFRTVATVKNDADERDPKPLVKPFGAALTNQSARFVRVRAKNYGNLPSWHPGAGHPAWLFADELIVE